MSIALIPFKDSSGASKNLNAVDTTGAGGPYVPLHVIGDATGTPINPATSAKQDSLLALFPSSIGQKATAASLSITLSSDHGVVPVSAAASELHIGEVGGNTAVVGGVFTRPANTTAYASGQLVANSTTAGSVTPITCAVARKNDGTGVLIGLRLHKSGTSITNAAFRVHLFRNSPTTTVGDAGTFAGAINGITAVALGYFDVTMDQAYSDGAKGFLSISGKAFTSSTGTPNIFALIEARGAYTPVSGETFTLALEALRD